MENNKLLWAIVGFAAIIIGLLIVAPVMIDKITDSVIDKIQKKYAPGPYAPGFDPDKVNPDFWRTQPPPQKQPSKAADIKPKDWNQMWEKYRE